MGLLSFLGIIILLDNIRRDLKVQWFRLWSQTRISLSSRPKRSLVDHSLDMFFLVSLDSTTSFYKSSKLVGSWYGILVVFRKSSPDYMVSSWTKIRTFQVSLQDSSLPLFSRVEN